MYRWGKAFVGSFPMTPLTPSDLIAFRYGLDISQQQLADILGIDRQTISRWECGLYRIPMWMRSALLGVEYGVIRTIAAARKAEKSENYRSSDQFVRP